MMLQTWNRRFYVAQFRGRFPEEHLRDIEALLTRYGQQLFVYRNRSIEDLSADEQHIFIPDRAAGRTL